MSTISVLTALGAYKCVLVLCYVAVAGNVTFSVMYLFEKSCFVAEHII